MIRSIQQFDAQVAECTKNLDAKLKGTDGKRHIVLCGGTGCLSSHSDQIMEEFKKMLKKHGAEDMATVNLVVGGYKAAAKIDVLQGGIMVVGGVILAVATLSAKEVGGLAEGLRRLREIEPFDITRAGRLMYAASLLTLALGVLARGAVWLCF